MPTNGGSRRRRVRFGLAVTLGLCVVSFVDRDGFAVTHVAALGQRQAVDSRENAARRGVCERESEKLVGQKAVRIGGPVRAPRKVHDVKPKYPEPPHGTVGSGLWMGEVLINNAGKVVHVWTLREVKFVPPFPAFNSAITDAIQQWAFEPLLVEGKPTAYCMTVTMNIHWQ